jgi:hypothetical protein
LPWQFENAARVIFFKRRLKPVPGNGLNMVLVELMTCGRFCFASGRQSHLKPLPAI